MSAPPPWRHPWNKPSRGQFEIMQEYEAKKAARAMATASTPSTPDRLPGESDIDAVKRLSAEREQQFSTHGKPRQREFFTDGSVVYANRDGRDHGGAAWTTFYQGEWIGVGYSLGSMEAHRRDDFSYFAELEAIKFALQGAEHLAHELDRITIVSDCKWAIDEILHACTLSEEDLRSRYSVAMEEIIELIGNFRLVGMRVTFQQITAHSQATAGSYQSEGNRVADKFARRASTTTRTGGLDFGAWSERVVEQPESHREGNEFDPDWFIE